METLCEFELAVPYTSWRPTAMALSANRAQLAVGTLHRDPRREPSGLLVEQFQLTPQAAGAEFPPMGDWIVLAAPGGEPPGNPDAWISRLEPRFAQLLVVLLVGYGPTHGDWRGWVIERGRVQPLAGFRIVGPGMIHAGRLPARPDDSPERWSRVRGALGERTFAKVRGSKVAVIGCSRSGTLIAAELAALGVRELALLDGDKIEPHNLDGMILASETDLGQPKAIALGRRLVEFRPDLLVTAVTTPFASRESAARLAGSDLIVTCVDRDTPRLRAARWAREQIVPHLDIGAGVTRAATGERQLAADVRLLLPGPGAGCVLCCGGLGDRAQAEYELHAPRGALPRRPEEAWNARGRLGSLIPLNSLAVSTGVQSWLDLVEGSLTASVWHRLRWVPGRGLDVNAGLVAGATGCGGCGTA